MGGLARIGVKNFSIDKAALTFMEQIMLSIYEGVYLSLGNIGDFQLFVPVPGIGIVAVFIIVYVISTWEGGNLRAACFQTDYPVCSENGSLCPGYYIFP